MEDNEEEDDDDNHMFPEYGDTARGKLKTERHQMSPQMMKFVGSSLMHIEKQTL